MCAKCGCTTLQWPLGWTLQCSSHGSLLRWIKPHAWKVSLLLIDQLPILLKHDIVLIYLAMFILKWKYIYITFTIYVKQHISYDTMMYTKLSVQI